MYHGLSFHCVRDESGKLVGFHLTTGASTWGESLIKAFLIKLSQGTADIKIVENQVIFTRDDMKDFPRAVTLSWEDSRDLRAVVTEMVAKIRSEPHPETRFNHLGIEGGFRIIPEGMEHLQPSGNPIRPRYPKES